MPATIVIRAHGALLQKRHDFRLKYRNEQQLLMQEREFNNN
jgi:hypothetical protein